MEKKLTLKQLILNKIEKEPRGYAETLAKEIHYSSGSALNKILRDPDRDFDKCCSLIILVRILFEKEEQTLIEQYALQINPNNKLARTMLEYLSSNRLLDSMRKLIDKMLACKNKESLEWARVYSLQYEWHTNYDYLDIESFINRVNDTKTNIKELKVFLLLLKFYSFYYVQNYRLAYDVSKLIPSGIKEIKDNYLRSVYNSRFNEVLSYIHLRVLNNPEQSRMHSEEVIKENIGLGAISYAHYTIGCSYLFTSYEKSLRHLNKSIELYESKDRHSVVRTVKEKVDLLNVIWDKDEQIYTITAKLLQQVKIGKLQCRDFERYKDQLDLSFYFLIKGIKDNDNDLLLQSLIQFIKIGDTFLGNLPRIELLKRNYSEEVLNALFSLNQM